MARRHPTNTVAEDRRTAPYSPLLWRRRSCRLSDAVPAPSWQRAGLAPKHNQGYAWEREDGGSLPDGLFESAEGFARRGESRSELYAGAPREYPKEHGGEGIAERLDEVYGAEEGPGGPNPAPARLQAGSLPRDEGR